MGKLIDADELKQEIGYVRLWVVQNGENESIGEIIDRISAVDASPVKRGHWVEQNPNNSEKCRLIECDQCRSGYIVGFNVPYEDWVSSDNRNFCGRCGADMRGAAHA